MLPSTVDRHTARQRAVASLAATALVGDVAGKLAHRGIPVMPLKGALLQHWLYDDPSDRPLTDVDLLVRPAALHEAAELLEAAGYCRTRHSSVGGLVMQTPLGLALDLHAQLFDRMRYRMPTDDLFARGSEDHALYGARVVLPSPLDVYAHLVGKFGSDHLNARSTARLDEIRRMGAHLDCSAETAARHLLHCGMRRVSRYVLPLVDRTLGDPFASQVCKRLPRDPIGRGIATAAEWSLARAAPRSWSGAVIAHALNDSVPHGLESGIRALHERTRRG